MNILAGNQGSVDLGCTSRPRVSARPHCKRINMSGSDCHKEEAAAAAAEEEERQAAPKKPEERGDIRDLMSLCKRNTHSTRSRANQRAPGAVHSLFIHIPYHVVLLVCRLMLRHARHTCSHMQTWHCNHACHSRLSSVAQDRHSLPVPPSSPHPPSKPLLGIGWPRKLRAGGLMRTTIARLRLHPSLLSLCNGTLLYRSTLRLLHLRKTAVSFLHRDGGEAHTGVRSVCVRICREGRAAKTSFAAGC